MALPAAMALSGINEDYFSDGLTDLFRNGALLLKSPRLASTSTALSTYSRLSASRTTGPPQESESSCLTSTSDNPPLPIARKLGPYFDLLLMSQRIELTHVDPACSHPPLSNLGSTVILPGPETLSIMYQNRNILDLAQNIKGDWNFTPAQVKKGPLSFFKNRSQFSRVLNADLPLHEVEICPDVECLYEEFKYR